MVVRDGIVYREIDASYEPHYRRLMESGLYRRLSEDGSLVAHEEVDRDRTTPAQITTVLRPSLIPLITYPYEWCFSALRRAALLVLSLERVALEFGMTLKDASAYNVQFRGTSPVMIDTLSFETYEERSIWRPYLQFCRHFLAPLALMRYCDPRAALSLRTHVDGIPLDLACSLLPSRTRLRAGLFMHLHLHARAERSTGLQQPSRTRGMSLRSRLGLIDGLRRTVENLTWEPRTQWSSYGEQDSYSEEGARHKKELVSEFLTRVGPRQVWDLGSNVGAYSRVASERGIETFAWDSDGGAVELSYREAVRCGDSHLLPLVLDLTNPSPSLGWAHTERQSLKERCRADLLMALALIHHLTIAAGIPFAQVAEFFASLAPWTLIEFVDREDPRAKRMLATRGEVRPYTRQRFEQAFAERFELVACEPIRGTRRSLYLMKRRAG